MLKEKEPSAVALGRLSAKRFNSMTKEEKTEHFKRIRAGVKVGKTGG